MITNRKAGFNFFRILGSIHLKKKIPPRGGWKYKGAPRGGAGISLPGAGAPPLPLRAGAGGYEGAERKGKTGEGEYRKSPSIL